MAKLSVWTTSQISFPDKEAWELFLLSNSRVIDDSEEANSSSEFFSLLLYHRHIPAIRREIITRKRIIIMGKKEKMGATGSTGYSFPGIVWFKSSISL